MSELKRCPFCGGDAVTAEAYNIKLKKFLPIVKCLDCGSKTSMTETFEEAIKAWNNRKPMKRIIERLERLKGKDFISSEDYEGNVEFHFYGHTSEHDEMIRFAIEIVRECNE